MIDTGYRTIHETAERSGGERLSPYDATDLAIQLNAFYLNVVGSLDNLAWATKHQLGLFPEISEYEGRRRRIGLFNAHFLAAINAQKPELASFLRGRKDWFTDLCELRDPAAHRIPIYAVPGVLDEAALAEYNRLNAESSDHFRAGDFDEGMNLQYAASRVGRYEPWMSLPVRSGHAFKHMLGQVRLDYDNLLTISEHVLRAVFGFSASPY